MATLAAQPTIEERVVSIVREHTLYEADSIPLDCDLEGELGIDSVLLRSILTDTEQALDLPDGSLASTTFITLREIVDAAGSVDSDRPPATTPTRQEPEADAAQSLADPRIASPQVIVTSGDASEPLSESSQPAPEHNAPTASLAAQAASPVRSSVLEVFRRETLYDAELNLDVELEGELGIDSLMLESILAEIETELGIDKGALKARASDTLRDVIEAVLAQVPADTVLTIADSGASSPSRHGEPDGQPSLKENGPATTAPPDTGVAGATSHGGSSSEHRPVAGQGDAFVSDACQRIATTLAGELKRPVDELTPDRPLNVQGLSAEAQRRLHAGLAKELGVAASLRLEDCDTLDKLRSFVAASAPHALRSVGASQVGGTARPSEEHDHWDDRSMKDFVEVRDPDIFTKTRTFKTFYRKKQQDLLYWYGMPSETMSRNRVVIYDECLGQRREFLNFASNNYVGLANHPRVIEAISVGASRYGATNTGCRIIGGTTAIHLELERRIARYKRRPACIVYPSGYSANLGVISALVKRHDAVILDKFNHMSIVDGAKLSGGGRRIYQHNDMPDLEKVLQRASESFDGTLIVADGVFSMHGDICDLPGICALARQYGARVMVDDAHSTGVLGARGSGTAEHFVMKGQVDLELGTMSKALGGLGGFVVGEEDVIDYLRFYSNSYVFAATIPAPVVAGLIASIDVLESEPERLEKLWTNVRRLRRHLEGDGFDLGGSESAILPVVVGDDRTALKLGRAVRARGLFCQTVVYPGVSVGDARLRISVTSEHTPEDLDLAAEIVRDSAREIGLVTQ